MGAILDELTKARLVAMLREREEEDLESVFQGGFHAGLLLDTDIPSAPHAILLIREDGEEAFRAFETEASARAFFAALEARACFLLTGEEAL